jgi:predicted CXXCH cytochrome family protein
MKKIIIILIFLLVMKADLNSGASGQGHEFKQNDCILCHIDEKNDPTSLKSAVPASCLNCHRNFNVAFSHPTERYPYTSTVIPEDMPLMDGKLTCLTCHYVHPRKEIAKDTFLRRSTTEIFYCATCHNHDKREHTALGQAHIINDKSQMKGSIDIMSKLCIECHEKQLNTRGTNFSLQSFPSKVKHPLGKSYMKNVSRKKSVYRSEHMLHSNLNLYDGKIGCGTCHNIFSRTRNLLVIDNDGSRLCLECHIK